MKRNESILILIKDNSSQTSNKYENFFLHYIIFSNQHSINTTYGFSGFIYISSISEIPV